MATDTNLSKLTPEEFTEVFMEGLKQELSTYELQANKVGFLGYLVNMLGNITYDSKIYKDFLFKEAFPATAQQDDNIYLHGSIYGYKPNLATPAVANGTISFDFSLLPTPPSSVVRQDVVFGLRNPMTQINIGNVIFSSDSVYTFVKERNSYRTVVSRSDGTTSTFPSSNQVLTVDFDNFKQERPEVVEFVLPNYNYGSYYTYTFQVQDEYISDLHVFVKMPDDEDYIEYDVVKVKYLVDPNATTVFFNQTASDTYTIEFGSGIHGGWIPGASIKIFLYKTIGISANFSQDVKAVVNVPVQMVVYNTTSDGYTQSTTLDPADYLKVNFKYSEGGIDPLAGEDLRKSLVNYIQTRDNFMSENDFYNIIEKYTTDFRLLFKKMTVQENVFYLQRAFRDEYQNVVRSRNLLPEIFHKNSSINNIHYDSRDTGSLSPGTYYYKISAIDSFDNVVVSSEISASLILDATDSGSILLQWNEVPGARKYTVYGRTQLYEYKWELETNSLLDDGSNSAAVENPEGIPEIEEYPYVIFPDFYSNTNEHFVSPFIYKFNKYYNHFEGWLFYPELLVNFASLTQTSDGEFNSSNIPSIYLNLIYDQDNKQTAINLKSYQTISEWSFKITIPELDIYDQSMTMTDESTFTYIYQKNHGLIINPIKINIAANREGVDVFTGKTNEVNQRLDMSDLLQLPVFTYAGVPYLVDVPCLDYDTFNENRILYLDKINNFVNFFNFQENRMISDDLEFRLLNTDSIHSYLLTNSLVQGKNLYKDLNFIEDFDIIAISDTPEKIPMNGETWIIKGTPLQIISTDIDGDALNVYKEVGYGGHKDSVTLETASPYSITVSGDYSSKFSAADIIRIKDATTSGINGIYHVLSANYDSGVTTIYVIEKINTSLNEGILYFATYEQWRKGGPDNIAKWDADNKIWLFTTLNPNDVVTISSPVFETYIYNANYKFVDYVLRLPLNLSLTIYIDQNAVNQYGVNLEDQRKQIKLEVAKYLQLYMTGTDIVYYPSTIVEFVTEPRRIWMKGMTIKTTDSSKTPFEFKNGIETYPEYQIRDNISSSKLEILRYSSAFYWWNVENIEVKYNING